MNLKDIQVAIVGKLSNRLMAKVESTFTAYRLWELTDADAFYTQIAPDIQALVTSGNPVMGASRALIEKFPNLKIIASNGVGYDPIDIVAAREHGVIVTNTLACLMIVLQTLAWRCYSMLPDVLTLPIVMFVTAVGQTKGVSRWRRK